MQIDRKTAMKMWESVFGKSVEAADFSGRKINKSAYDQRSSKYGWVLSMLVPKAEGGKLSPENLICLHTDTANEKGDDYPVFTANDRKYRVFNDENGMLSIEEAKDDESIAEQEAKNAAALEKWDQLFGTEFVKAKDFCGRIIHKSEYNTDSEFAWKVAPYVESKPAEGKNSYIAHVLSVEEALGKTAFKANGVSFTLNKESGAYFFKALQTKPAKKPFDIKNPYDVQAKIANITAQTEGDNNAMVSFIIIRAVTKPSCTPSGAQAITDTVSMILKESIGAWLGMEVSDMADEQGVRYMFLTYRFATPSPADFEKVFSGAQLLNTYSLMLLGSLGLDELKIYNYAGFIDRTQLYYPITHLCGYQPQIKALLDAVYSSAYGFYPGENATTLYVSHFIVFNVPSLASMHPENATQYFTAAEMIEHNTFDPDASGPMFALLSGAPAPSEELPAEPADDETEEKVEEAELETVEALEEEKAEETVESAEENAPVEEAAPVEEEPSIEPENAVQTENAVPETASEEEIPVEEIYDEATVEVRTDYGEQMRFDTDDDITDQNEPYIASAPKTEPSMAIQLESTLARIVENAHEEEKPGEKPELPTYGAMTETLNRANSEAAEEPKTVPDIKEAFPAHEEKAEENSAEDDDIPTIDFDSLQ